MKTSIVLILSLLAFAGCTLERPRVADPTRRLASMGHTGTEQSCSECHESARPTTRSVAHGGGADCVSCHRAGTTWTNLLAFSHTPTPSSCLACHEVNRPAVSNLPRPGGIVNDHHGTQDCAGCHMPNVIRSPGVFAFNHKDSTGATLATCLPCHEGRRKTPDHYPGQDCARCHLDPTKTWLVSSPSPHPANFPAPTSCGGCHESARPAITRLPAPASGSLSSHFLAQDCIDCHNPKTTTLLTFRFAHSANGREQKSCATCHEAKRPSAAHYPGKDCVLCHTDPTRPWNLPTTSPHPANQPMPARCDTCHETQRPTTTLNPPPGTRTAGHFTGSDCFGCHLPRSTTVATFAFAHNANGKALSSCLPCHEPKRPVNHHVGQDCIGCHTDPGKTWTASAGSPHPENSPALLSCNGCHTSNRPLNTVMTGNPAPLPGHFSPQDCYSCHEPRSVTLAKFVFDHNANGIPRTTCIPCHTPKVPTGIVSKFSHQAVPVTDCVGCHKDPGGRWAGGIYGHTPTPTTCSSCHAPQRPTIVVNKFNHSTAGMGDCASCHSVGTTWAGGRYSHSPVPTTCSSCHSSQRPTTVINKFNHSTAGMGDCASCHSVGTTWAGGRYSHSPVPTSCNSCHSSQRPTTVVNRFDHSTYGTSDCASCHSVGTTWAGGRYSHSPVPTSCNSCHSSQRPTTVVNNFSHSTAGMGDCASCHSVGTTWAGGRYSHSPVPTTCNSCHSSQRPTTVVNRFDHSTYGTSDCVGCHSVGTTWAGGRYSHSPVPTSCNTCHDSTRPTTTRYPNGSTVTGHYTAKDCAACHMPASATVTLFRFSHSDSKNANISFCLPCHLSDGKSKHGTSSKVSYTGDGNCYTCHNVKRRSFNAN